MRLGWSRQLIIGIGIGLIIAASLFLLFDNISDQEIERRARAFGMIYRSETLADQTTQLLLAQPTSIDTIATELQQGGIIADQSALLTEAANRKITTIAAGRYLFKGTLTPSQALNILTGGGGQ